MLSMYAKYVNFLEVEYGNNIFESFFSIAVYILYSLVSGIFLYYMLESQILSLEL